MTEALCLFCGGMKWGALNPCPECHRESTGDWQMDILFSDHHLHVQTLEQLGKVIKVINTAAAENEGLGRSAFMLYMSDHHPSVLRVKPDASFIPAARAFLAGLTLPEVELLPGRHGAPDLGEQIERGARKRWWQFWKQGRPP